MPREELLQYIWKTRLFDNNPLKTTCGKLLEIVSPGDQNIHAGPDFFNSRIRIGSTEWAGNVEIHRKGSHWQRHGHQNNPEYNNVILHVVTEDDTPAFCQNGVRIHTLLLDFPGSLYSWYEQLQKSEKWLPCHHHIHKISRVQVRLWLTRLQGTRLEQKSSHISEHYYRDGMDWETSLYRTLASGFGLPINSLPFEMTSYGIPLSVLLHHRDSLADLEGIFFGQAGFLQTNSKGPYETDLHNRYCVLRNDLSNRMVKRHLWKFLRLRPASFPTLRLSQFASLVHLRFPLLDSLSEVSSMAETEQLLKVRASRYWDTHYLFGKCSPPHQKYLGNQAIRSLVINSVVPFLFSFGKIMGHQAAIHTGTTLIEDLKAESNHIIKNWATFGIKACGAFESQALIHLYNNYCKQKRCLDCQIGKGIIQKIIHEEQ
jgi:hypothetical protein